MLTSTLRTINNFNFTNKNILKQFRRNNFNLILNYKNNHNFLNKQNCLINLNKEFIRNRFGGKIKPDFAFDSIGTVLEPIVYDKPKFSFSKKYFTKFLNYNKSSISDVNYIKELEKFDAKFSKDNFTKLAATIFIDIQKAIYEGKLQKIRDSITANYFSTLKKNSNFNGIIWQIDQLEVKIISIRTLTQDTLQVAQITTLISGNEKLTSSKEVKNNTFTKYCYFEANLKSKIQSFYDTPINWRFAGEYKPKFYSEMD
eukprot:TRINITY_DN7336_c0_g1_i1.p1 TRINITY_DN7336_c0_g1~~TRINITY_DN7336_c0_g1_i1.p1  ORF type:complete len:257 (-),score=63.65 TRINITY_DN7336_c0_g1_i1:71-841(-)